MSGFTVQIEALRGYGENLKDFQQQATTFSDLVERADVGDESWGVVGLATKGSYDQALEELTRLIERMKQGLEATADKIKQAADIYASNDLEGAFRLGGHRVEIDKVAEARPGS
ncbi:type VII secretion target [Prauserella oleivorans]|uniref:Type VII secretion target n=1 Tax=Prauserella oleivorans TaxID=1478153 RepID=A0ABW5W6P4_9PSEU